MQNLRWRQIITQKLNQFYKIQNNMSTFQLENVSGHKYCYILLIDSICMGVRVVCVSVCVFVYYQGSSRLILVFFFQGNLH